MRKPAATLHSTMSKDESALAGFLRDLPSDFRERADHVFGSLPSEDQVEPAHTTRDGLRHSPHHGHHVGDVKFKGRVHRVYFKTPSGRSGTRFAPDYMRHPEKWTKYDLKEDGTEKMRGMSANQVNKAAALQFLQKRKGSTDGELRHVSEGKCTFQRPKGSGSDLASSSGHSAGASDVHVMQEYEIGKKREQKKKALSLSRVVDQTSHPSVKLSHLDEDESSE